MKNNKIIFILLASCAIWMSCGNDKEKATSKPPKVEEKAWVKAPSFSSDSAYAYIQAQVAFGPRVPGTQAHKDAGDFLVGTLKSYGAKVTEQEFDAKTFDGVELRLRNIFASFYPEKKKRILIAAHWDTRPFADKDTERKNFPIEGANDGGSGVGVALEFARLLEREAPANVGVDIVFFDGEDWGELNDGPRTQPIDYESWWCLGSQYWSQNKGGYSAYYGILLDMVGSGKAQFNIEETSNKYAPKVVERVWSTGQKLGYGQYFINRVQPAILDDHVFVNEKARIPMIDIVHYDNESGYFGDFHHTHQDNMDIIDKNTLKAVGQTIVQVIWNE